MPSIHFAWLSEALWKPQLQSHCSLQCFTATAAFFLCPHPLPAGLFLAIVIYAALLHSIFNCETLPYLIPNAQFLPSSVITSVLASHPSSSDSQTTYSLELAHTAPRSALSLGHNRSWEHPLFLLSPYSCNPVWSWYLSVIPLVTALQIHSVTFPMHHNGCIEVA